MATEAFICFVVLENLFLEVLHFKIRPQLTEGNLLKITIVVGRYP